MSRNSASGGQLDKGTWPFSIPGTSAGRPAADIVHVYLS